MKTFYPGCKVNTNIPVSELFFAIKIYDEASKKYIFDMKPVLLNSNKEANTVFISRTDIPVNAARKHRVTVYLYRSWSSSKPKLLTYRDVGSLAFFDKPDNFKQLSPLKAKQSKDNSQEVTPKEKSPTVILRIPRSHIFVTPEYPSEHPNDPFRKEQIEKELKNRIAAGKQNQGTGYPDQMKSSLCGPAAYFYCLLKHRPDLYRQAVRDLWEEGKTRLERLQIEAGDAAKPKGFFGKEGNPKLSGIDWITMGSLRDSENFTWSYNNPIKQTAAITPPWEMYDWLKKTGAENLKNLITVSGSSSLQELVKINEYAEQGYRVVQLMSSPNIFSGATTPNFKAHWIVWESPLCNALNGSSIDLYSQLTDKVDLKLFTWGWVGNLRNYNTDTANIPLRKFLNASFGAIIFKDI